MRYLFVCCLILVLSTPTFAQTTVPNTFTSGAPANADEVNANFNALLTAINVLEAKVAALESADNSLTIADVAGAYKLLSLSTKTGSNAANHRIATGSRTEEAVVTFNLNGTFSYLGDQKSSEFRVKTVNCASGAANTSSTNDGSGPHTHQYTAANCDQNAASFDSQNIDDTVGESSTGTWALAGGNMITITPVDDSPMTAYFSKHGRVGFMLDVYTDNDPISGPIREFSLSAIIKQ